MLKNLLYLADTLPISGAYPNGAPPSIPFVHGVKRRPLRDDLTTYGSGSIFSSATADKPATHNVHLTGAASAIGLMGAVGKPGGGGSSGITGSDGTVFHYLMGVESSTSSATEGILYGPNGPHTGYVTRYQPQKFYRFILSGSSSTHATSSGQKDHLEYYKAGGGGGAGFSGPEGSSAIKSIYLVISGNLSGSTDSKGTSVGATYDEVNVYTSSFKSTGYLPTASLTGGAGYTGFTTVEISTSSFPVYIVFTASQEAAGPNPTASYAGFALWWTGSSTAITGSSADEAWPKHGQHTINWGDS
jgi:hypothetical protein